MGANSSTELKCYEIEISSKYILDITTRFYTDTKIYSGRVKDTKEEVVFKLQKILSSNSKYIIKECKRYIELYGIKRIPRLYGVEQQGFYIILIIELLVPSLKLLLESVGGKFTLATTLKICTQVLDILKEIHSRGIVLRYLKPGNIVIGKGENKDYIYLIDFEIAKKFIKDGKHIPDKEGKKVKGNRDFISLNTHCGKQVSRRDDIECLGYLLIYFVKGELPWTHIKHSNDIKQKKMDISLEELCEGLPEEFKELIKYSRELEFQQEPDYCYLKGLLEKVAKKNRIDLDNVKYDWVIKEEEEKLKEEQDKNKKDIEDKTEGEKLEELNEEQNEEKEKQKNEKTEANIKENEEKTEPNEKEKNDEEPERKGEEHEKENKRKEENEKDNELKAEEKGEEEEEEEKGEKINRQKESKEKKMIQKEEKEKNEAKDDKKLDSKIDNVPEIL